MTSTRRRVAKAVAAASVALLMASCSSGGGSGSGANSTPTGKPVEGGSVSFALKTPNWILPISTPGKTGGENQIFQLVLYKPLYQYKLGTSTKYNLDTARSLADSPAISADGRTYTIKLKSNNWSDGQPITTRDVEFWWNLVTNNKSEWASYRQGSFPDNVSQFKVIDKTTFSITTRTKYSPDWFIANQLNKITPMPQHAWDKTSDSGSVSDTDRTPAGAKAVFGYLNAASKNVSTYSSNALWKTVSGPFTLKSYVPNGEVDLAKNTKYTGTDKPHLDDVVLKPFTSDDSEFNVLRSGGVDYGYIPAGSINQKSYIQSKGYTVEPWNGWSITYMPFNFNNPVSGPIFAQKYVRQAMQYLIDQPTIDKVIWQGAASPTCGPVPQKPGTAGTMKGCAYSFDPAKAKQLLESHGWKVVKDGTTTCQSAGTGANQCGAGVKQGAKLSFTLVSQSGFAATTKMMAELKSQFSEVGIVLNIKEVPDSVAVTQACKKNDPNCSWDLSFFGSQSSWYYPVYASGERLFQTGAPVNLGSYSNPTADKLIDATTTSSDASALEKYNSFLAEDLPVLWMPNPVAQISAWKSTIKGIAPQDPMLNLFPQDWALTK